jgi:hypothetical protein
MTTPPTDPRAGEIARAKLSLTLAFIFIGLGAVMVALFVKSVPLKVFIVASDLIVMSALWLVVRQKFSGK